MKSRIGAQFQLVFGTRKFRIKRRKALKFRTKSSAEDTITSVHALAERRHAKSLGEMQVGLFEERAKRRNRFDHGTGREKKSEKTLGFGQADGTGTNRIAVSALPRG